MYISTDPNAREKYQEFVNMFNESRFLINQDHDFIKYYLTSLTSNILPIDKGATFFRARINGLEPFVSDEDLGAPPQGTSSAGRVNPKGISYLYVSECIDTVIAEVQPWLGAEVTIAQCTALEQLKVVDLLPKKEEELSKHSYRRVISKEFSKPVRPDTKELDYLPTQYIAEYFKQMGFDGLRYESAVHFGGKNLAFYNPEKFKVERIKISRVHAIEYKF